MIEHDATSERYTGDTVGDVAAKVVEWLQIGIPQDIEAVMTFLRTEEGGRKMPVFSGYRPQFHYQGERMPSGIAFRKHEHPAVKGAKGSGAWNRASSQAVAPRTSCSGSP